MLILTRKIDQGIVIGGDIYVRVLGVERDRVKIGISAPQDVTVLRQELLDKDRAASSEGPEGDRKGNANPNSSGAEQEETPAKKRS